MRVSNRVISNVPLWKKYSFFIEEGSGCWRGLIKSTIFQIRLYIIIIVFFHILGVCSHCSIGVSLVNHWTYIYSRYIQLIWFSSIKSIQFQIFQTSEYSKCSTTKKTVQKFTTWNESKLAFLYTNEEYVIKVKQLFH